MSLRVLHAGPHTTVQDLGRVGWQRFGVSQAGAMDPLRLRVANRLAGNPDGAAGLEWTLQGPELMAETELLVGVAGEAVLWRDDERLPSWRGVRLRPGQRLRIDAKDLRGWIAVAGGVAVPEVLGSRSTHVRSGLGGLHGRVLRDGDVLPLGPAPSTDMEVHVDPPPRTDGPLRVLPGPQAERLAEGELTRFLTARWQVSPDADRMGCRLQGPRLQLRDGPDLVSEGTPWGSVQVPGDGQPIVLLADRQTTGGYVKIATVVRADMGRLAQLRPGDTLQFRAVTQQEAVAALTAQEAWLAALPARPISVDAGVLFTENLVGGVVDAGEP